MKPGPEMSSSILYGDATRPRAERWWLVPAVDTGLYSPLNDVPITGRLLADLAEIPQTLSDDEKSKLSTDLEWRAEQGWGFDCGYMEPVGRPKTRSVSAPGEEPRLLLPATAVIRVLVSIPELVSTKGETLRPAYQFPCKFRISSMGLPEFDPWKPEFTPDPS